MLDDWFIMCCILVVTAKITRTKETSPVDNCILGLKLKRQTLTSDKFHVTLLNLFGSSVKWYLKAQG